MLDKLAPACGICHVSSMQPVLMQRNTNSPLSISNTSYSNLYLYSSNSEMVKSFGSFSNFSTKFIDSLNAIMQT